MIKIDEIIFKELKELSRINFFLPEIESYYMGHSIKNENNERNYKIFDETRNYKVEYFYNCIKTYTRIVDLLISEKYVETNIKIVFIYQFY